MKASRSLSLPSSNSFLPNTCSLPTDTAQLTVFLFALTFRAAALNTTRPSSMHPQCWSGPSFPPELAWHNYSALFKAWTPLFASTGSTPHELAHLLHTLEALTAAPAPAINPAFALALVIQESQGNTCAPCGDAGASCGLLQVQGPGVPRACAAASHPCPDADIALQLRCGIRGCPGASGSNIAACCAQHAGAYGPAARCYNSGSVEDPSDLRRARYGDRRYVQNIANILLGADCKALEYWDRNCGF